MTIKAVLAHLEACPDCRVAVTTLGGAAMLRGFQAAKTAPAGGPLGLAAAAGVPVDIPPEPRDHAEFEAMPGDGGPDDGRKESRSGLSARGAGEGPPLAELAGRMVELRGPFGPGGVQISRVRFPGKPKPDDIELREDQLILIPPE